MLASCSPQIAPVARTEVRTRRCQRCRVTSCWTPGRESPLTRYEPDDFELLRRLGGLSYRTEVPSAATLLSWTVRDAEDLPDSASQVPDALRVQTPASRLSAALPGALDGSSEDGASSPALWLFAARQLSDGAPVLLKAHAVRARGLAEAELRCYEALWQRTPGGLGQDAAPVAPVLGWFTACSPHDGDGDDDGDALLWVVQRWTGVLASLAAYPFAKQRAPTPFWPPLQRVRDAPLRLRARFATRAACGGASALAWLHSKRVAHGALDASCILLSTQEDAAAQLAPDGTRGSLAPVVRLSNLGFACVGHTNSDAEALMVLADVAQADCRALGCAIAECVFSALSSEGPGPRTSAAALRRLFDDIFQREWDAILAFCTEEPAWSEPCALLARGGGAGWALIAALWDDGTYSGDAQTVIQAREAWLAAVEADGA